MVKYVELDEVDRDMLRELGSIGTGNAVTSLSKLTNRPVEIEYPDLKIVKYQKICSILNEAEELDTGIVVEINGELEGIFLFLLEESFTGTVLTAVLGETERDVTKLDAMEQSLICEVGNIMCGSYIRALSQLLNIELDVSVPETCIDMGGAILNTILSRLMKVGDDILVIENCFHMNERSFIGRILFLPEYESMKTMIRKYRERTYGAS